MMSAFGAFQMAVAEESKPELVRVPAAENLMFARPIGQGGCLLVPKAAAAVEKVLEILAERDQSTRLIVQKCFETPEQRYALLRRSCGCPPLDELKPPNMSRHEIAALCTKRCDLALNVEKKDGVLVGSPIGHMSGKAVDVRFQKAGKTQPLPPSPLGAAGRKPTPEEFDNLKFLESLMEEAGLLCRDPTHAGHCEVP